MKNGYVIVNHDWEDIAHFMIKSRCKISIWSVVQGLTQAASVYFIWKERNMRIFHNAETIQEKLYYRVIYYGHSKTQIVMFDY